MALTWGELRDHIRTGILNDNVTQVANRRWSDAQLLMFYSWSIDSIAAHTAKEAMYVLENFVGTEFDIPEDTFDDFGNTALVTLKTGATTKILTSVFHNKKAGPLSTGDFYVPWGGVCTLSDPVTKSSTLTVKYFSRWSIPTGADDEELKAFVLDIPPWSYGAAAYYCAANAMASYSTNRAQLGQWAENPERGNPEDNPFRIQHKWFMSLADGEMNRNKPQHRANFFGRD